ncbi:putative Ulp1 protease family catalytic domain-containing protein [Rosa chinensis]|uniref:Putative Ulp1 protease family catalytic domain-containing protein n=1 Tax=Rosa chinensis TaxID=74649 RepID=A0A2P6QQA8_ROSCH|nr:putative Ulp1 protease family catalytic domain-containing protein [Rosa chinensis]
MSRKGYANLEEELKMELGTKDDIDRAILWKKGRVDKEGNYLSETTKQRADKIDALTKDVREGIVSAVGRNDILTQALETPEQSGRVRGAGQFVTHKVYFNTSRYKSATKTQLLEQQLELMQNQINMFASLLDPEKLDPIKLGMIRDMFRCNNGSEKASCSVDKEKNLSSKEEVSKVASEKEKEKKATAKKVRKWDDTPSPIDSSRESKKAKQLYKGGLMMRQRGALEDDNVITSTDKAYIPIETANVVKKGKKCKLAVDTKDNIVAMGTVIMLDGLIHGVPLGAENIYISIDVPIKEDANLPIPNESAEIFTVKQATGTHVAWPRHLVLMSHEENSMSTWKSSSKTPCKQAAYKMPVSVHLLLRLVRTMDESIAVSVPMEEGVFGNDHNTFINGNDIIQFCSMQPISTICISIYMRHLWSLLKMRNEDHLYAFVDPGRISNEARKVEARSCALSLRLESAKLDQLILASYNTGNHWLLAAINTFTTLVYYFDPLSNININPGMKNIIELSIKMFNAQKGRKSRKPVHWEVVKCPRQPGSVECGYYVMKYMKEIIGTPSSSILNMFEGKETYTQEEIDVVRIEWAEQVDGYIEDEVK